MMIIEITKKSIDKYIELIKKINEGYELDEKEATNLLHINFYFLVSIHKQQNIIPPNEMIYIITEMKKIMNYLNNYPFSQK